MIFLVELFFQFFFIGAQLKHHAGIALLNDFSVLTSPNQRDIFRGEVAGMLRFARHNYADNIVADVEDPVAKQLKEEFVIAYDLDNF